MSPEVLVVGTKVALGDMVVVGDPPDVARIVVIMVVVGLVGKRAEVVVACCWSPRNPVAGFPFLSSTRFSLPLVDCGG